MADQKISALTELTNTPGSNDEFVIVDKFDTSMAASGTDKRLRYTNLLPWNVTPTTFEAIPPAGPVASFATGVANTYYAIWIRVLAPFTLTGIRYRVGATSNGNVRCALFTGASTKVADRTTNLAQGTANNFQQVGFDSTFAAVAGSYIALLWFSSATATTFGGRYLTSVTTGTNASNTPATITTPAPANTDIPVMSTY